VKVVIMKIIEMLVVLLVSMLAASCGGDSDGDADADSDVDGDSDAESEGDADSHGDGGSDADANADSDPDGDTVEQTVEEYFRDQIGVTLDDVYWGEFHAHTTYSIDAAGCTAVYRDDTLDPPDAYAFARETSNLDFVCLSDHAEEPNPTARPPEHRRDRLSVWQSEIRHAMDANVEDPAAPDALIVFAGWEYTNTAGGEGIGSETGFGHKNVVFRDLDPEVLPEARYGAFLVDETVVAEDATALWAAMDEYRGAAFTIVHTPAMIGGGEDSIDNHSTDWDYMDSDFVRHVEVMSKWGTWEGNAPDAAGCDDADVPLDAMPEITDEQRTIRTTLYERWIEEGDPRFVLAFVGGTDTHAGRPASEAIDECGFPNHGGMTGVVASALSRNELWEALTLRHTLAATTGNQLPVLLAVETGGTSLFMGEQGDHDGSMRVRVLAGAAADEVHLVVDGCLVTSVEAREIDVTLDIAPGRHFVYARALDVRSEDDHRQSWSSPVYLGTPE
jgi:hypothetical protein